MVERGMAVGIGTDDGNCNDSVNMIGDMKFMAHIHRAVHRDADVLTPEKILEMATIDGARSLGMDHEIGSIETGKRADLILLDLRHPQTTPHHHLAATIVFQAYGNEVDTVLIDGNVVMENRRLSFLPLNVSWRSLRKRRAAPQLFCSGRTWWLTQRRSL
jgi:cytosine/adenosine deaminase-related metal-dependent hydrolase